MSKKSDDIYNLLNEIKNFTNGKKYSLDKQHFLVAGKQNYRLETL